jgi:parallel beta-helix repeat protein
MTNTNGIQITNNVIYNTYRSGIVINGKNNTIQNNLVTMIYWSGTAEPSSIAQFNMNYDGAIMSRDAVSVIMQVCIYSFKLLFDLKNDIIFFEE